MAVSTIINVLVAESLAVLLAVLLTDCCRDGHIWDQGEGAVHGRAPDRYLV